MLFSFFCEIWKEIIDRMSELLSMQGGFESSRLVKIISKWWLKFQSVSHTKLSYCHGSLIHCFLLVPCYCCDVCVCVCVCVDVCGRDRAIIADQRLSWASLTVPAAAHSRTFKYSPVSPFHCQIVVDVFMCCLEFPVPVGVPDHCCCLVLWVGVPFSIAVFLVLCLDSSLFTTIHLCCSSRSLRHSSPSCYCLLFHYLAT